MEFFDTIRSRFQLKIDIGVSHLIAHRPVADNDKNGIPLREIQEMMTVPGPSREPDTHAGPDGFPTRVRHEHELALYHVDELILLRMRVTGRRLAAGQDPNEVDAVVLEPRMVAQASVETLALSLPERLGIARRVALWHIGWSEDLRSLCHPRLLARSLRGRTRPLARSTCKKATVLLAHFCSCQLR